MFSLRIARGFTSHTIPRAFCSAAHNNHQFPKNTQPTEKVKKIESAVSESKKQLDFLNNPKLRKKAIALIFGDRDYNCFDQKERNLVDSYQDFIEEEDGMVLPNTHRAEEAERVARLFRESRKKS